MDFQIEGNPDYGDLTIRLQPGDVVLTESGAMSRMSGSLEVKSRCMGGILRAVVRKLFGGESFFVAEYTASTPAFLSASPTYPGTILHRKITAGDEFYLTAGTFLACTPGVHIDAVFGGLKALFSGEGAFLLKCHGDGDLYYASFGSVIERDLDGGLTVDTGHVVAWESTVDYKIGGMGGLKATLFSGEGLVMNFSGRGKIYLQTRNLGGLVSWLSPFCIG